MKRRIYFWFAVLTLGTGIALVIRGFPDSPKDTTTVQLETPPLLESSADASRQAILPITSPKNIRKEQAALGKKLFYDIRLSRHQDMNCATCHILSRAGDDGKSLSPGYDKSALPFNTPSLFNVAYRPYLFWDGRATSLHAQISIDLKEHMGTQWNLLIPLLKSDADYEPAFAAAFVEGITPDNVVNALAEFERTLVTPDSRFDRFLRGEQRAISTDEKRGYALFLSYGCVSCHQGAGVGGNMFERLGVVYPPPDSPWLIKNTEGPLTDLGRFNVTGNEKQRFYFRVPSLRNVEKTAPYFHDGSIEELEDAIRIMAYYNLGANIPEQDVLLLAAFLKTLTGEYLGRPL